MGLMEPRVVQLSLSPDHDADEAEDEAHWAWPQVEQPAPRAQGQVAPHESRAQEGGATWGPTTERDRPPWEGEGCP